jgi:hypothetical protein
MDSRQYITNVNELIRGVSSSLFLPAVNELLAEVKNRISRDGKNTGGSKIGDYSSKEGWFSKDQFAQKGSFKNKGKTGKPTKSTMYLAGGYKQLRQIQGRSTAGVNETYSGSTMASYQLEVRSEDIVTGMVNERSAKIREGQEKKFGTIFSAGATEIQDYAKNVAEIEAGAIKKILSGVKS